MNSIGTQTIEGTGLIHPSISGVKTMLNLYSAHTAYRGVPTSVRQEKAHETKTVTMNYRGMVYTKQVEVAK